MEHPRSLSCDETNTLLQSDDPILMLFNLVRDSTMQEVVLDVLGYNIEMPLHSFLRFHDSTFCFFVIRSYVLHEKLNILLRRW